MEFPPTERGCLIDDFLAGTVFTKRVALGGRRYAIQKVYRHSQAVNQSSEEKSAIKASLDAPLTVGSLKAGGERSWGSTSGDGDYGNVTIDVNSLVIDGGDETLTEEYVLHFLCVIIMQSLTSRIKCRGMAKHITGAQKLESHQGKSRVKMENDIG